MIGFYAGSFDPITNGHTDIIKRASLLYDKVYVIIVNNVNKKHLFTPTERIQMAHLCLRENLPNVYIVPWDGEGLLVNHVESLMKEYNEEYEVNEKGTLIRGLRNPDDFGYEMNMDFTNKDLSSEDRKVLDTIYLMSSQKTIHISSSLVREVYKCKADISKFVHNDVRYYITSEPETRFGVYKAIINNK